MSESSRKCSRLDSQNSQLKKELDDALAKLEDRERGLNSERMDGRDKISKLEEMNRELTYQLREKSKDS
jgi:prefoldin subunit 5